jgi:hypothetical protein
MEALYVTGELANSAEGIPTQASADASSRRNLAGLDRAALIIFAFAMAALAVMSAFTPKINWDGVAYTALIQEQPGMSNVQVHDRAYSAIHSAITPRQWAEVTTGSPWIEMQFNNAAQFSEELGMYRIKVGYVYVARAIGAILPPLSALRLVNSIALALITVVAIWWMAAGKFEQSAFFVFPAWMAVQLYEASQLTTPDMLNAALALAGLFLLRARKPALAAFAFALATITRLDFIVFPLCFLAVAVITRTDLKAAALCFLLPAAATVAVMLGVNHPSWWDHFNFSLGQVDLTQAQPFTIRAYLIDLAHGIDKMAALAWPGVTALCVAGWLLLTRFDWRSPTKADVLFVALVLSLAARCVIFPLPEARLYLPTMMMIIMLVAERWSPRFPAIPARSPVSSVGG